jgi:multiple sugar transport system permease protein
MKPGTRKFLGRLFTLHIPLVPFILFALFPFYFMAVTSLKSDGELYTLVSVLATGVSIAIAFLAAHSLARLRFQGAASFGTAVFITYLVPTTLLFLPLAQVVHRLGLADSVWALIVTYPTVLVPFCTWLLLGYFRIIPQEVEECAMVDGCTRFHALIRIVLPVAIPGIVCMAGVVLSSIPIVLVYVVFMDYYVSGLTQGAIK